jgi:streptogramin lyase
MTFIGLSGCVSSTETQLPFLDEVTPSSGYAFIIEDTPSPTTHNRTLTPEPTVTSVLTDGPDCPMVYIENRDDISIFADMELDRNGVLWLAGLDGVTQWHPETGLIARYTISDGLTSDYISAITITPDGEIWAAAHVGCVLRFDGAGWTPERSTGSVTSLRVAPNGFLWVSAYEPGNVHFYDGISWTNYIAIVDATRERYMSGVTSLIVLENDDVWATENCCMSPTRLYSLSTFEKASEEGRPTYWWRMIAGPDGSFWMTARWSEYDGGGISGNEGGVARYDPVSDSWSAYLIPRELLEQNYDGEFYSLELYSTELLWVSDRDGRVLEFREGKWHIITSEDGFKSRVTSMVSTSDGKLWVATRAGVVAQYNGTLWQMYEPLRDSPGSFD